MAYLNSWSLKEAFPKSFCSLASYIFCSYDKFEGSALKSKSSTSNYKVAFAGIEGGEPYEPYA